MLPIFLSGGSGGSLVAAGLEVNYLVATVESLNLDGMNLGLTGCLGVNADLLGCVSKTKGQFPCGNSWH